MKILAFSGGKDSMACLHLLRDTLDCAVYVDTGYSYPETDLMVEYAATLIPLHRVASNRGRQNGEWGIPSDLVPVDWTRDGQQVTTRKPIMIQSYLNCCFQNIAVPLWQTAKDLGATTLVFGQRNDEHYRAPATSGTVLDGITREHPIADWTAEQVLTYLSTKMSVPAHYTLQHSSLDCYDCTGYHRDSQDRHGWMLEHYPDFYRAYMARREAVDYAIAESLKETMPL